MLPNYKIHKIIGIAILMWFLIGAALTTFNPFEWDRPFIIGYLLFVLIYAVFK
jgi:hypothetical protein